MRGCWQWRCDRRDSEDKHLRETSTVWCCLVKPMPSRIWNQQQTMNGLWLRWEEQKTRSSSQRWSGCSMMTSHIELDLRLPIWEFGVSSKVIHVITLQQGNVCLIALYWQFSFLPSSTLWIEISPILRIRGGRGRDRLVPISSQLTHILYLKSFQLFNTLIFLSVCQPAMLLPDRDIMTITTLESIASSDSKMGWKTGNIKEFWWWPSANAIL